MPMHNPPHPGEALRLDVLPALGLSITALVTHLVYSRGQLSTVLNGRAASRADMAVRLELAGQVAFDLWQIRLREYPPITRLT